MVFAKALCAVFGTGIRIKWPTFGMVLPDDSSDVFTGIACLVVSESVMKISSQRGTEEEKRYRRGREGGRRGAKFICHLLFREAFSITFALCTFAVGAGREVICIRVDGIYVFSLLTNPTVVLGQRC